MCESLEVKLTGVEQHTGTTPMNIRKDTALALSEIVLTVNKVANNNQPNALGSVGHIEVSPNSRNVIAGQTTFDESYNGNILVNAMTLGLVNKNKIFYSKAAGLDKPVIYVGSKTGRDGIHGASMASATFDDKIEEKKPTVQVGDPFTEKLLLEACLELMADNSIIAIQDMGAAGLTSSSVEMASKGNLGIELNLSKVPCREEKMTPYEIMLSESQERMLIVLEKGKEEHAKKILSLIHISEPTRPY